MTTELESEVALVTGGTSGIGRNTAVLFAKAGAKVVVASRREPEGNETIELIRTAGGDGLLVKADISMPSDVDALIQMAAERFGRLDIAFNNAGIESVWVPIVRQSEADWDRTIAINLKGVWLSLKLRFVPQPGFFLEGRVFYVPCPSQVNCFVNNQHSRDLAGSFMSEFGSLNNGPDLMIYFDLLELALEISSSA
jgi:NAD(P)-dependent dehydrogenase (short-subunit alcohol dehydrogenase family)